MVIYGNSTADPHVHTLTRLPAHAISDSCFPSLLSCSRLRCFGGLAPYVVAGQLTDPLGLAPDQPYVVTPTEVLISVGAPGGTDGTAANPQCASSGTSCATLKGAVDSLAALASASTTIRAGEIRVIGRTTSAQATVSSVYPSAVVRLTISGLPSAAGDAPTVTFTGTCAPSACLDASGALPAALSIINVTFRMASVVYSSSANAAALSVGSGCSALIATSAAALRVQGVTFSDAACASAMLLHTPLSSSAVSARLQTGTFLTITQPALTGFSSVPVNYADPTSSCDAELVGVLFTRIAAPYGYAARAPGVTCLDVIAVHNATVASLVLVDKALGLRAVNLAATSLTASLAYPAGASAFPSAVTGTVFAGLANITRCGGLLRANSVSALVIENVTASSIAIGGAGGGVLCVLDDLTYSAGGAGVGWGSVESRPTLGAMSIVNVSATSVVTSYDATVTSAPASGPVSWASPAVVGGAAVMIARLRRSARLRISDLACSGTTVAGPQHSGGCIGLWSVADVILQRVTCSGAIASSGAGGCIFASDAPGLQLGDVRASGCAALDGGGCLAFLRSNPAISGSLDLQGCTATAGPGGALLFLDPGLLALRFLTLRNARASRGHGGALAVIGTAASSGLALSLSESSFVGCWAGERGGAVSVISAQDIAAPVSATITRCSFTDGGIAAAPALPARNPSRTWEFRSFVANGISTNAVAAKSAASITGGGGLAIVFFSGDASATNATAVMPVPGSPGNAAVAAPAVDVLSAVFSNLTTLTGNGGAVLVSRATEARVLARSQVIGCMVTACSAAVGSGGGLYMDSAAVTLSDSVFVNNTAATDGGAVFTRGSTLTSTSVVLAQNVAGRNGGGLASENCALTGVSLIDPGIVEAVALPSASPSVTPSQTSSSTWTPSETTTATATESPDAVSQTPTPSKASLSATITPSITASVTGTGTPTATITRSFSATASLTPVAVGAAPVSSAFGFDNTLAAAAQLAAVLTSASYDLANATVTALFAALRGVHIAANGAANAGGGVALSSCNGYIGGAQFTANIARDGGGLSVSGKSAVSACVSSWTGNMALGAAAATLRSRDGSTSPSSTLTRDALFSPESAAASSLLRGDGAGLSVGYGGAIAAIEPDADVSLCSAAACDIIARLSRRGLDLSTGPTIGEFGSTGGPISATGGSSAGSGDAGDGESVGSAAAVIRMRVPLSALWPYQLWQASAAISLFGAGEAYARVWPFLLRGPPTSYAGPYSLMTSIARGNPGLRHGSLPGLTWPLAPADYTSTLLPATQAALRFFTGAALDDACPFAGNFAAGPGGDVGFVTIRDAADVGASAAATLYASRMASVASHSDASGGSIAVRTLPAMVDGSLFYLSAAGKGAREAAAAGSWWSLTLPRDSSSSVWDGALQGYGGALALRGSVGGAVVNTTIASPFARAGGAVWVQPPIPSAVGVERNQPPSFATVNGVAAAAQVAALLTGDSGSSRLSADTSIPQQLLGGGIGGVLLGSLTVTNASAVSAGGWLFSGGTAIPDCINCTELPPAPALVALSPATAYGRQTAGVPVSLSVNLTAYGRLVLLPLTVPGFGGASAVTAAAGAPLASAPLTISLLDAQGQLALSDYTTVCTPYAYKVDSAVRFISPTHSRLMMTDGWRICVSAARSSSSSSRCLRAVSLYHSC